LVRVSWAGDMPHYLAVALDGPESVTRLRAEVGEARFSQFLELNRIDFAHALRSDTLVVPRADAPSPDAFEAGRQVRWGAVSSGSSRSPTPPGLYHVNWKARKHASTIDSTWIMRWCLNLDNASGIALHQYALPGYPASHRCIRLLEEDARWLYDWVTAWALSPDGMVVEHGTPVIVFGAYDDNAPPPWRRLPSDPQASRVQRGELDQALAPIAPPI
jgi:hypothetical protein